MSTFGIIEADGWYDLEIKLRLRPDDRPCPGIDIWLNGQEEESIKGKLGG